MAVINKSKVKDRDVPLHTMKAKTIGGVEI
jgi:hypothetical protein